MTYEEVARVVGSVRHSSRFKTVTDAWRRAIYKEHRRLIGVVRNEGFYVLNPSERVDHGRTKILHGFKTIRKARKVLEETEREPLTVEEVKALDYQLFVSGQAQQAALAAIKRHKGPSLPSSVEDKK